MKDYEQLECACIKTEKEENKTYYEQLEVFKDATKMEIKKAYFRLVKKYPPEKFPEEFKSYRKAYEVLFDENARLQYDKLFKVPKEYKVLYDSALSAMEYRDYENAIRMLKEVVAKNPELEILNSLLGDIYLENENSGNAIKLFERLTRLEPDNAGYQGKLAQAYTMRGFTKKAILQFEKSLAIDPDNMVLWKGLSEAYSNVDNITKAFKTLEEGITRAKETGVDGLNLHIFAFYLCVKSIKNDKIQEHMEVVKKAVQNDPSIADYITQTAFIELNNIHPSSELLEGYYQVICFLYEINPQDKKITMIKEDLTTTIALQKLYMDENISDYITNLTQCFLEECDCPTCKMRQLLLESEVLFNTERSKKELRYLKDNYPQYYSLHKEFYDKAMDSKKTRRLQEDIHRKIMKYEKKYPMEFKMLMNQQDYDDYEDDKDLYDSIFFEGDTYVRDEPKIGRNDPCPCGSGKKYKRCCGIN